MSDARLVLERRDHFSDGVLGLLTLQNHGILRVFDTLELPYRNNAVRQSSIPVGDYHVIARKWGRYYELARQRWEHEFALQVVIPGTEDCGSRRAILLHWGNTPDHTLGCPLVGERYPERTAARLRPGSRAIYRILYDAIAPTIKTHGHIPLTIQGEPDADVFDRVTTEI